MLINVTKASEILSKKKRSILLAKRQWLRTFIRRMRLSSQNWSKSTILRWMRWSRKSPRLSSRASKIRMSGSRISVTCRLNWKTSKRKSKIYSAKSPHQTPKKELERDCRLSQQLYQNQNKLKQLKLACKLMMKSTPSFLVQRKNFSKCRSSYKRQRKPWLKRRKKGLTQNSRSLEQVMLPCK